jgi:iron complex outermembrane recepter protein
MTPTKMKKLPVALIRALGTGAAVTLLVSPMAIAQQATPTTPQQPQKIEKIEVTGSNIKRVDSETASPIQVITADEIRQSGRQTVTELLRELPINAAGGLTELTGSGSFSAGAASVSLRGLGSSATLVLLNGRRVAPYGLADPNFGQASAVNLNAIPVNVIERIEILKDGASAIYGSEAIAGVINIILRKDYKGAQVAVSGTANKDGDYRNGTATASIGFGDLAKDRYNAFITFEGYKQDSVLFKDVQSFLNRQQFRDVYSTGLVSSAYSPFLTVLTDATGAFNVTTGPNCPASNRVVANQAGAPWNLGVPGTLCLYDNVSRQEIVPEAERASVFARGTFDLSGTTQLYGEGSYVKQSTYFLGFPQAVGQGTGATFNPSTGRLNPAPTSLVAGHPNNPFNRTTQVRARMDGIGPQDNEVESETTRGVVGFRTTFGKFDFESGLLYNRTEQNTTNYNALRYDRLIQAFGFTQGFNAVGNPILVPNLAGGTYDWNNPNGGTITANSIRINAKDNAKSTFSILDAKLSGELMQMAGGGAGFALGLEYRKEDRVVTPDAEKLRGNIFGRGVATAKGDRNVSTVFGELVLPVLKNVEVQTAVRYDRYSDYGNSVTPKLAAAWSPLSTLKLRGSFARGFRAPSLTEITRSSTSGFFNGVDDPRRCNRAANITVGCGLSIPGLIQAFEGVQPEKAETYTGGFVWDITPESSATVDYFSITRRNEITFLSLNEILLNEGSTNPLFANRVFRDPANTSTQVPNDPGAILYVSTAFANLGRTTVRGFDLDLRHRMSLGEYGRVNFQFLGTRYTEQRGSGTPDGVQTSFNGYRNAPNWRAQFITTWNVGNWNNRAAVNAVGQFKSFVNPETVTGTALTAIQNCGNPTGTYLGVCTVPTYVTIDASTEYVGFKNLRLTFAVRNLANARPSIDPLARPFNTAWYQPQGINFILGARYTFW